MIVAFMVNLIEEDTDGRTVISASIVSDFIKTENLYTFDGERGYSLGQGE